jgi:hypothetical protein
LWLLQWVQVVYSFGFSRKTGEPNVVMHAYNPSYLGGRGRRMKSFRPVWVKLMRAFFKNKMVGRCSSSGRMLA